MKLVFETKISQPVDVVKSRFTQELFLKLSPKFIPFRLKRFDGCKTGDIYHIEFGLSVLKQEWIGEITFEETNAKGWSFIDEGKALPWPLKVWKHYHIVDKISDTECCIVDDIFFECSSRLLTVMMRPVLWLVFAIRPHRYQKYFKELQ